MARRFICPQCEAIGAPKLKKRGSTRTEVMAWMAFPFGVPYTIWRMFGKIPVCRGCGHGILIDAGTTVGMKMEERIYGLAKKEPSKAPIEPSALKIPLTSTHPSQLEGRPERDPEQF